MKRVFLLILLLIPTVCLKAQSNYYQFSAGAGAGITQSFTEVSKHDFGLGGYGTLDYLLTPYVSAGLEYQQGEINSGDYRSDPLNRQSVNRYRTFSAGGKIALGELLPYGRSGFSRQLRALYVGAGIGVISNKMKYVVRQYQDPQTGIIRNLPGQDQSKDIYSPLNLGINFYFADRDDFYRYVLNINYQGNITLGEGLDGYDYSQQLHRSGKPDCYTFLSVGVKYNFGPMGLSRKTFRRY